MKDRDDDIDFSEEGFTKRFRRIDSSHRKHISGKNVELRDCKSRITIYLDADIVDHFKSLAEERKTGYQTLINESLRRMVDNPQPQARSIKQELLEDKAFLQELKEALPT